MKVFCEEDVDFGGWIVIQRRQNGIVDFNRDWHDYKEGFGDLTGNYWIGLEKLHALTSSCEQELYIQLKRLNGTEYYAKYSAFVIANETEGYALKKLGVERRLVVPRLLSQVKTFCLSECVMIYRLFYSFLNGVYGHSVNWNTIQKEETLSFAQMMIRPNTQCIRRLMLSNLN
ncbi:ryncolin-1-like isoform X2 [Zeugodacus cucurbitae]|uniref:ryncolin-1-like isoform X2 n=1 Tax=Zeugodacus cucurbitae TaxID=28588 RepID=UPI0023D916F3|nr:ryncolin-1-like isoform X2 [Zeugodacus cucurbitae]